MCLSIWTSISECLCFCSCVYLLITSKVSICIPGFLLNYLQSQYFKILFRGNELYLNEFVSNKTMNWTEAVQYCRTRNSILVSSPTQTDHEWNHWTRKQWRISPWIHVIGMDLIWVIRTKQEIYTNKYID